MNVVQNMGDHMIGNTFVRYVTEEMAETAVKNLTNRFYAGRKVLPKLSPVQDFEHSRCNDYVRNSCSRGQFCNFAHFMTIPRWANQYFTRPSRNYYRKNGRQERERDYKTDKNIQNFRHEAVRWSVVHV
eukprot:UN02147